MRNIPQNSFFLLGPRGTGKSTWLKASFPGATWYDLLNTQESLRLERAPYLLSKELARIGRGGWVVLDEVQKIPALLDEVQSLIENQGLRFALCGSSARKLKRRGANLLAGRASLESMFPFVSAELGGGFEIDLAIRVGTLPLAVKDDGNAESFLRSYATLYLNEEIRMEALTRNVGAFARFLEVAARQNGQITNVSGIARDAGVGRTTVQNYFEILVDTLLGYWVEPWKLRRPTKQVGHPKFYLFDTGVVRALSGRLPYPPTPEEEGVLLETVIANELRTYFSYRKPGMNFFFWRTHDGAEVDFFFETNRGWCAVEVKAAREWRERFGHGLDRVRRELTSRPVATFGVYRGERPARFGSVEVLPVKDFLQRLWEGALD